MEGTNTVVVGGGPAGLAVSACLKRRGVDSVVLERGEKPGWAWHNHYERLHLHTNRTASALPNRPMSKTYGRYPSRDQVAAYLGDYSQEEGVDIRTGVEVLAVDRVDGGWSVATSNGEFGGEHLVLATGMSNKPWIPEVPGRESFAGDVLHSAQYLNAKPFLGQRVLVVGFGNSAGEIALDLSEHGVDTDISVRSPSVVVPRDIAGIPILTVSRWLSVLPPKVADLVSKPLLAVLVGDISKLGVPKAEWGPLQQIAEQGKIPLLDVGTVAALKKEAIKARPGIESLTIDGVSFVDGSSDHYEAVIFGTGYEPGVADLLNGAGDVLDESGRPKVSGAATGVEGLYFCGFFEPPTGRLREIGFEAERIADLIAADVGSRSTSP